MRKTLKLLTASMIAAALMTGCGETGNSETSTDSTTGEVTIATESSESGTETEETETTSAEETEETTEFTIRDYSSYVSLGTYKGIPVTPISVTDEEISDRIAQYFHDIVEDGDTVNIDYTGYLNGEPFDGGSAQGASLQIGSGQFIDGFESGLIGAKVGDTVELNLTFPEAYPSEEVAGKAVVFQVTVNAINNTVAPEYTLDNVVSNTSCQTLEEYEQQISDEIYSEYVEERMADIWNQVIENATISGYPQEEVDVYAKEMKDYYEVMASQYNVDFSTFLSANGYTEETFQDACQTYGKNMMDETMVLHSIASAENMTVTEEEYRNEMDQIISQTGLEEADILSYYGGETYIRESLLFSKIIEFLEAESVEE